MRSHLLPRVGIACLLAAAQTAILLHVAWDKSDTADETRYVAAAAALSVHDEHRDLCEAPSLPKRGFGLALRAVEPTLSRTPHTWQRAYEALIAGQDAIRLRRLFFAARCATIVVVVLAGFLVFAVGSRFGRRSALVSHALWCFSPTLLANGSLAALDAWAAAIMAVVLWASVRLIERGSGVRALILGVACGGAAATKIPTLLIVPLVFAVIVRQTIWKRPTGHPVLHCAGLAVTFLSAGLLTLWAIYDGSVGGVSIADPCPFSIESAPRPAGWLPFPAWIEGLVFQLRHANEGHPSYLFGEVRTHGWWWFYLACLALKVPLGTQAIAIAGTTARLLNARRRPSELWLDVALLSYPAVLFFAMSSGRHQANISFLLPGLPFVCVWLGCALSTASRALGRPGGMIVYSLLMLAIFESLRVHPHYLMFYNVWAGGPEGGPRYLIHREDWGQDKRRLAEWQRERQITRLYYAPYGPNAEEWGIVFSPVPCEPTAGVYALHAAEVHRPTFSLRPGCIDWLTIEPPDERLGYSIYIYSVDAARLRALRENRNGQVFWRSGPRSDHDATE